MLVGVRYFLLDPGNLDCMMPKQKGIKRSLSDKLQTRNTIIYFSSNMKFQTEIFQGMFSTIITIRPCKFYVNL